MKAVVYTEYGTPDVLKLEDIAQPLPDDNEVLIKIHAAAVTAIDMGYRRLFGRNSQGKSRRHLLGHYLAGEVEEVGKDVKRLKKGDHVCGGDVWSVGTYAEYKCMGEKGVLVKIPPNLSYEEAATITYGGLTALPFLRDAGKIRMGQKVLIIGASGSIGAYAVQLARYYGADVTGICSTDKIDMVKSLGATRVIDYTREDFTKNGQTYDIIFDTPAKSTFTRCKHSLTTNGRYLTTVPWPGEILQMLWTSLAGHKKGLFRPMGLRSARKKTRDLSLLNELFAIGKIKPVLDRCYPLEKVVEAYRYVEKGYKKGNVVIIVRNNNKP